MPYRTRGDPGWSIWIEYSPVPEGAGNENSSSLVLTPSSALDGLAPDQYQEEKRKKQYSDHGVYSRVVGIMDPVDQKKFGSGASLYSSNAD